MKRVLVITGKTGLAILIFFLLFVAVTVAPVDETLPANQPFYTDMLDRIDSLTGVSPPTDTGKLAVGFGKASITPSYPTATAGYVKRKGKPFSGIRDSVCVRTIALQQAGRLYFVISLDMLIVPPLLYEQLASNLPLSGYSINQVFLGATHTHNSIGQWDDSMVGEIYAGDYHTALMDFLVQQIVQSIKMAKADLKPAAIHYGAIAVREAVTNRLIRNGPVDSLLHVVEVNREDGTKGILTSFTAHATCLSSADLRLSRDYPGELVDLLESNGYSFAMFMAGAVGSHAPIREKDGDTKIKKMGDLLFAAVHRASLKPAGEQWIQLVWVPLSLGMQQVKVLPGWRVRSWLSERVMGEHKAYLSMLKIGNLVMLGTPCDFSGMLTLPVYQQAEKQELHAFITSFNGGYIGYITPDSYYNLDKYETQTMNWYGPGNGSYLQDCLKRMLLILGP
jgi:neutral ceramidase